MKHHWPIVAVSILSLVTIDAAYARAKHHRHYAHYAPVYAPVANPYAQSFEPARMIEVRPGLIISSYDCVTDEGYGRYSPCSAGPKR